MEKELEKEEDLNKRNELRLAAEKGELDFERAMEKQRRELESRLEEQRRKFEEKAVADREALENSIHQRINAALQAHHVPQPPPPPPIDFSVFFEAQERQMKMMSEMICNMSSGVHHIAPSPRVVSAKRTADVVDLTVDHEDFENMKQEPVYETPARVDRKRRDVRETPKKPQEDSSSLPPSLLVQPSDHAMSPSSDVSFSMVATPDRRHPSTWVTNHRTPETVSTTYGQEEHGDDPSDRQHEEDTTTRPPFTPYGTQSGFMDDESITPTHLEDIYAQHSSVYSKPQPTTLVKDEAHEEMSLSSDSPQPWDTTESRQAQPEDKVSTTLNHD